ncbi:MAG: hypothetical protein AAF434_03755 [Pseudomonadota bacterium]
MKKTTDNDLKRSLVFSRSVLTLCVAAVMVPTSHAAEEVYYFHNDHLDTPQVRIDRVSIN